LGLSSYREVLGGAARRARVEVVPCCRESSDLGEDREREVKRSVSSSLCEVF
jgi:hypothetical protein